MRKRLTATCMLIVMLITSASFIVGFNTSPHYKDEIENLKKIKEGATQFYDELEKINNSINFNTMENVDSQITEMNTVLQKIEADKKAIAAFKKTGVNAIDLTYDAAIEFDNQLTDFTNDIIKYLKIFQYLFDTLSIADQMNTQNMTEETIVQTLEDIYTSFEQIINNLEALDCPVAMKSRLDVFTRKLKDYQLVIVQLYRGYSKNDFLTLQQATYLMTRVEKEYNNAMDDFANSFDISFQNVLSQSNEIDVLKDEILKNTDTLLGLMEGK